MPSGHVCPSAHDRTQPKPPPETTAAQTTSALPVGGGAKQSQTSSHPVMKQVSPASPGAVRQLTVPVLSGSPVQLQSVLSTMPRSLVHEFHSPGTTGSHCNPGPVVPLPVEESAWPAFVVLSPPLESWSPPSELDPTAPVLGVAVPESDPDPVAVVVCAAVSAVSPLSSPAQATASRREHSAGDHWCSVITTPGSRTTAPVSRRGGLRL